MFWEYGIGSEYTSYSGDMEMDGLPFNTIMPSPDLSISSVGPKTINTMSFTLYDHIDSYPMMIPHELMSYAISACRMLDNLQVSVRGGASSELILKVEHDPVNIRHHHVHLIEGVLSKDLADLIVQCFPYIQSITCIDGCGYYTKHEDVNRVVRQKINLTGLKDNMSTFKTRLNVKDAANFDTFIEFRFPWYDGKQSDFFKITKQQDSKTYNVERTDFITTYLKNSATRKPRIVPTFLQKYFSFVMLYDQHDDMIGVFSPVVNQK